MNENSSRFGKFLELTISPEMRIQGATVAQYLLEKSRVCTQVMNTTADVLFKHLFIWSLIFQSMYMWRFTYQKFMDCLFYYINICVLLVLHFYFNDQYVWINYSITRELVNATFTYFIWLSMDGKKKLTEGHSKLRTWAIIMKTQSCIFKSLFER